MCDLANVVVSHASTATHARHCSPGGQKNDAPIEILAIRAKLKERDHEYQSALADLELLVKKAPNNIQAWIEITNINRVQGNYEAAWKASERIVEIADKTTALIAQAPIMTATGRSAEAYTALEKLAPIAEEHWPEAIDWVLTMRAEVARALGHEDEAEQHFQAGLERSPEDQYLLRSYADLLIEQHREEEVVTLLNDHINDTGILLRATIAAQRVGKDEEASAWQSQLEQRFEEIRLRGDRPHGRYESRYWLELKGNPEKAFTVGMENWHKQKEPRDTQNVLEAAVAANLSLETVQPVVDFIEAHKVDHTVLLELVTELKGSR